MLESDTAGTFGLYHFVDTATATNTVDAAELSILAIVTANDVVVGRYQLLSASSDHEIIGCEVCEISERYTSQCHAISTASAEPLTLHHTKLLHLHLMPRCDNNDIPSANIGVRTITSTSFY